MIKQMLIARHVSRLARDRRAAAAAEFALILPIFLVMMCGTLQYGVLFYTWNVTLNGVRNAARALAVGRVNAAGAETMMVNALPAWVRAAPAAGTEIDPTATDAVVGSDVTANITFPSSRATFLPLAPMPARVNVTVRMVKEA
ncbi:MAG: TadE/TadG family type IV pilus assembly protein [Sandarakinorhabdus sp.]|jgi:Flp pilus assembly protein TadG